MAEFTHGTVSYTHLDVYKRQGMVTSVFLLIYALLSPVGGFLADRYRRRLMILCSLVVWSVVTWWTCLLYTSRCV